MVSVGVTTQELLPASGLAAVDGVSLAAADGLVFHQVTVGTEQATRTGIRQLQRLLEPHVRQPSPTRTPDQPQQKRRRR